MTNIAQLKKDLVGADGKAIKSDVPEVKPQEKSTQMPEVKGFRMLCAVPEVEEAYANGIIKSDKARDIEEHSTVVLFVLKMGDLCYKDKERFPTGPWCKEGDFIIARAYSGTRIKIHGREFRIINDDTVEAVVDDPRGYERA